MQFALDQASCSDVLTHFDAPKEVTFILGRLRVELDVTQTSTGADPVLHVEFEGIPATKNETYRGDRYVGRRDSQGDESEHVVRRLNALASKYSDLRDSMVTLKDIDVDIDVKTTGRGGDQAAKGPLLTTTAKRKLDIPATAGGVEAVDSYAFDTEATTGPDAEGPSRGGVYTATVQALPSPNSAEAKKGLVKVALDVDGDDGELVWARVMAPSAGNQFGQQCLPREGQTVAVVYPSQDAYDYPFILGALYDGMHSMPYDDPEDVGLKSQTERSGKRFGNQLLMVDEADEEEFRTVAPKYRTHLTGLEKDVDNSKRTYYKLKTGLNANPEGAPSYVSKSEYTDLPSKDSEVAHLQAFVQDLGMEYGKKSGLNPSESISISKVQSKPKTTKFKLKKGVPDKVKKQLQDTVGLDTFIADMSDELRVHRKNGDVAWAVADGKTVRPVVGQDEYAQLGAKTTFTAVRENGSDEQKSGIDALSTYLKYVDGTKDPSGDKSYQSVKITAVGTDAYEDTIRPYRQAYELSAVGQDAYEFEPYQEAYTSIGKSDVLSRDKKGVLDACEGEYKIHTFGDRVEICRAKQKDNADALDQEQSGDFKQDKDLPGHYDSLRSDDDKPLLILSKDGTVSIQATDGINIESGGDIQLQAKKNIKMHAGENIEETAHHEMSITGKEVKVGSEEGEEKPNTKKIEHISDHKFTSVNAFEVKHAKSAFTVKAENIVLSFAGVHKTTTGLHWINTLFGVKAEVFGSTNTLVKMKEIDALNSEDEMAGVKERLTKVEDGMAQTRDELTANAQTLAMTRDDLAATNQKLAKTQETVALVKEDVTGAANIAMEAKTAALFAAM